MGGEMGGEVAEGTLLQGCGGITFGWPLSTAQVE